MKIDLGELYKNKATLDSSVKNVKSTIQSARDYLQALADSEALQGKVKTAIDAKLKNHQIPLMTNYLTALSVLSKDYTTLLQTFKDTVGETSNRAIIDTDALRDLKKPFSGIEQGLSVIQRDTAAIYESIADIIELANPSTSQVIQDLHAAKQVLTDTESKMAAFNQMQSRSSFEEMMAAQTKELRQLSALQDLGYTNKKALSYYQRTDFVTSIAEAEKQSNSQVYRLALQNELAKILNPSKRKRDYLAIGYDLTLYVGKSGLKTWKNLKKLYLSTRIYQLDRLMRNGQGKFVLKHGKDWIDRLTGIDKFINQNRKKAGKAFTYLTSNKGKFASHLKDKTKLLKELGLLDSKALLKGVKLDWKAIGKSALKVGAKEAKEGAKWLGASKVIKEFKAAKGVGRTVPILNGVVAAGDVVTGFTETDKIARKQGLQQGSGEYLAAQGAGTVIDTTKIAAQTAASTTAYGLAATAGTAAAVTAGMVGAAPIVAGVVAGIAVTHFVNKYVFDSKEVREFFSSAKHIASQGIKSIGKAIRKLF
ncbi:hypothetical protein D8824_08225 [Streptococcus intermedius]|uniref:T7SS effector LXG polymorphic toxin n=1 Tax=Streptococcus intermedius TaxID=1338 RepID=UPI00029C1CFC|nr:T7SS effector LXG polymorphic toxin [Streptococcus intermedius]EKU16797.1 LXG domain of WXG superfamily protein [Streptococcus intermedius BA1]RSJ09464.1 hypothetical protein D8833_08395 [Streptococcus intermedius]RSJ15434.1 hypothetical protein D8831_08525 [Streptococcus intermedius]RSJ29752.1 hypothetical protein D8824_08225 [Streptococcus intermedius]